MNGTKTRISHALAMITKHPCLFISGLLIIFAVGCTWISCRGENISPFPSIRPLFPGNSHVQEISNGSLDTLATFIDYSSLKFVMYYAPWCGQSRKAVPEFIKAANALHKEVTFIAINCWSSPCQKEYNLEYFPQLVAYHSTFSGVQYPESSDVLALYMIRFLQNILRPFTYIGRELEIEDVKATNQEVVLSYVNSVNSKVYRRFFGAALEYVGKASRPFFGLVIHANLAKKEGLNSNGQLLFYKSLDKISYYQPQTNSTIKNITQWISQNRKQVVIELIPTLSKKQTLMSKLNEKPAVILFLPVRRQKISTPLLRLYTRLATDYNNCTCINTTRNQPILPLPEQSHHSLPKMVNPDDIHPSSTQSPGQDSQKRTGKRCYSFLVGKKKHVKSYLCESCIRSCIFQDKYFNYLESHFPRNILAVANDVCWSYAGFCYDPICRTTTCCHSNTQKHYYKQLLKNKIKFTSDKELKQKMDSFIDSFYDKILKVLEPLQQDINEIDSSMLGLKATKKAANSIAPMVMSTVNTKQPSNGTTVISGFNSTDGCNRTGHVTQFTGAACRSNRSVNFFYMDSERFWGVAKRLGVDVGKKNKTCLVVIDTKDEAYYVMREVLPVTNQTIVDFVMEFMNARLERTFRSAAAPSQTCTQSEACVKEVTLATLDDIVMDENKDVLLVYYAPWCGFCINLAPVLLTVARFFKDFKNVVIARIDGDQNDLPWQHTVTSYPTIILYPARRKDFSVRFPDNSKRTAEALIHFILQHGTEAAKYAIFGKADHCCDSDVIKNRINQLESSLRRLEMEKHFLETRLEGVIKEKSLLEVKQIKLVKGVREAEKAASEDRDARLKLETKVKEVEETKRETFDKNVILALRNAQLTTEITDLKGELHNIREKSHTGLKEMNRVMKLNEELEEENELLVKKLDLAVRRIMEQIKRDKYLSSRVRRLQVIRNIQNIKLTRTGLDNIKHRKLINDLNSEKRTLKTLLKDAATTIKSLKASLASSEKQLGVEEEKRDLALQKHKEANDRLKEMKVNYEKLTVILSQIDIPKKQQVS